MKSMLCLFVLAIAALADAHPGGLTGIPLGGVPISSGLVLGGLGHGLELAPKLQPISPVVVRPAQPTLTVAAPVKTIVSAPLVLKGQWGGVW